MIMQKLLVIVVAIIVWAVLFLLIPSTNIFGAIISLLPEIIIAAIAIIFVSKILNDGE